jgi:hypothetical protein
MPLGFELNSTCAWRLYIAMQVTATTMIARSSMVHPDIEVEKFKAIANRRGMIGVRVWA